MSTTMPPAVLLGGEMIALAAGRSLSAAGVPVYALGHHDDPLRHSRDRRAFVDVGMGDGLEERFMDALERGPRTGVVISCSDEGLELVARHRREIVDLGYQPTEANDEVVLGVLDKQRTFQLATDAGIEAPWVQAVRSAEEARPAAARAGYPCVLKPQYSHRFAHRFPRGGKAFLVSSQDELESALELTGEAGVEMIVSEIVPGPDTGICSYYSYLDEQGRPLLEVTKRKLRQYPPQFGLGCYHVTDWNPEVAELGLRFFQGIGLRGLANVEFKRDERDGRLKLIECNHRLTSATEQLRRCGADLPLFTYKLTLGAEVPASMPYRTGVGMWYPLNDLRAFAAYRRRGELSLAQWLRSLARPQTFPLASIRDPLPSLAAIARRGGRLLRRTSRRRRTTPAARPVPRG